MFARALRVAHRVTGDASIAEDLAAEACARAFVHWRALKDSPTKENWVVRVTSNLAIDALRKLKPRLDPPPVVSVEEVVALRATLREALRRLPRGQRQALVLRHLVGLSEAETADVMGLSTGSVKTHVHRALATLRKRGALSEGSLGTE